MFQNSLLRARAMAAPLAALIVMTFAVAIVGTATPATAAHRGITPSDIRMQCTAFRGAYALGTSIKVRKVRIPACGPRPAFSLLGGLLHDVLPFLSGFAIYPGYQCVELSVRYLATRDGVRPPFGIMNGAQVVNSYARRYPTLYVSRHNGARHHPPKRGDVISLANNRYFRGVGHTGVVIASHVNRRGTAPSGRWSRTGAVPAAARAGTCTRSANGGCSFPNSPSSSGCISVERPRSRTCSRSLARLRP